MADIVENPLGAVGGDEKALSRIVASDSDAKVSVFWPDQQRIGALLATADGGPSALCYALQGLSVGVGVFGLLTNAKADAEGAGMSEPNALLYIKGALMSLGFASLSFAVSSARKALCPAGTLGALGAGEVLISARDAASNSRWHAALSALSAFAVLVGLYDIASGVFVLSPLVMPSAPMVMRITWVLLGLLIGTVFPVAASGWWASMRTGSSLCRDAAVEVIKNVKVTNPEDETEWEEKVNQPALALRKKFELLSNGWSGGLVGMAGLCWFNALAFFTKALNEQYLAGIEAALGAPPGGPRIFNLVNTIIFALLPFPLAADIAYTSSFCDHLMSELNEVRANYGPGCHQKIRCLEITLEKLVPPPHPPRTHTSPALSPLALCLRFTVGCVAEFGPRSGVCVGQRRDRQAKPQQRRCQAHRRPEYPCFGIARAPTTGDCQGSNQRRIVFTKLPAGWLNPSRDG